MSEMGPIRVRSRRRCRISSWPAANGMGPRARCPGRPRPRRARSGATASRIGHELRPGASPPSYTKVRAMERTIHRATARTTTYACGFPTSVEWSDVETGRRRAESPGLGASDGRSFDDLICPQQRRGRNSQVERARGFRLMTSSNLVGRSMGKIPGFAPLRILSTSIAARRSRSLRSTREPLRGHLRAIALDSTAPSASNEWPQRSRRGAAGQARWLRAPGAADDHVAIKVAPSS